MSTMILRGRDIASSQLTEGKSSVPAKKGLSSGKLGMSNCFVRSCHSGIAKYSHAEPQRARRDFSVVSTVAA